MKYDLELSLADANTSHAQVVDLVGTGNRVLDVGCATGYLARALKARGNTVSGVEIDAEAAQQAEPDLAKLVVGDLETMDFGDHFEAGSFDVIVFADVLEHLRDPMRVLRDSLALLAPGGSVVVSLPNIAHGSVRLSLLEGRFEYRPLGLLDDTHLRFFTRRSVEELLAAAGLLAVDMRRTTADAFATEIPLDPGHFSAEEVNRVRSQADGDTYQFVFRAVPLDGAVPSELSAELVARNEELQSIRAMVGEIQKAAAGFAPQHRVGLLVEGDRGPGRAWSSLRNAVTSQELRRRLDGVALVHLRADGDGTPATWRGEPVESLAPGDEATAELVADVYDAVLLAGGPGLPAASALLSSLADRDCPVIPVAATGVELDKLSGVVRSGTIRTGANRFPGQWGTLVAVPDPLVLADRLPGAESLPLRREYLEKTGRLPAGEFLLAAVGRTDAEGVGPLARVLSELASSDCAVVVVPGTDDPGDLAALARAVPGSVVIDRPSEADLLALVDGCRHLVTDSAAPAALGLAMRRPVLAFGDSEELDDLTSWAGDPDLRASTPGELLARTGLAAERAADTRLLDHLRGPIEAAYDDLASAVSGAAARRLALSITEILRQQQSRIAALEQANAVLQTRMVTERNALGARATALAEASADTGFSTVGRLQMAEERLAEAEKRAADLQAEIDRIMATKTMRLLTPGRKIYGRMRHLSQ